MKPDHFAYFYNYLSATQQNVTGVYPTAQGAVVPVERREELTGTAPASPGWHLGRHE
jgi:hypothetical protein